MRRPLQANTYTRLTPTAYQPFIASLRIYNFPNSVQVDVSCWVSLLSPSRPLNLKDPVLENHNISSFSLPQRVLHWLTVFLVFFNLLLPDGMSEWNRAIEETGSASANQIASANIHAYVA